MARVCGLVSLIEGFDVIAMMMTISGTNMTTTTIATFTTSSSAFNGTSNTTTTTTSNPFGNSTTTTTASTTMTASSNSTMKMTSRGMYTSGSCATQCEAEMSACVLNSECLGGLQCAGSCNGSACGAECAIEMGQGTTGRSLLASYYTCFLSCNASQVCLNLSTSTACESGSSQQNLRDVCLWSSNKSRCEINNECASECFNELEECLSNDECLMAYVCEGTSGNWSSLCDSWHFNATVGTGAAQLSTVQSCRTSCFGLDGWGDDVRSLYFLCFIFALRGMT